MISNEEQQEYECVSRQSEHILCYMEDRFKYLMENDRNEDAIAVGNEFLEWISQDPDEVFLFYNARELKAMLSES